MAGVVVGGMEGVLCGSGESGSCCVVGIAGVSCGGW